MDRGQIAITIGRRDIHGCAEQRGSRLAGHRALAQTSGEAADRRVPER